MKEKALSNPNAFEDMGVRGRVVMLSLEEFGNVFGALGFSPDNLLLLWQSPWTT